MDVCARLRAPKRDEDAQRDEPQEAGTHLRLERPREGMASLETSERWSQGKASQQRLWPLSPGWGWQTPQRCLLCPVSADGEEFFTKDFCP